MGSTSGAQPPIRVADPGDARAVATLLHDFNIEYDTPTPDVTVLTARLRRLLAGRLTFAVLAGRPEVGVALVTLRTSLWYEGFVATLDELYVAPGHRGQGLGSRMLAAVEDEVRRRGGDVVEINVDGDGGERRGSISGTATATPRSATTCRCCTTSASWIGASPTGDELRIAVGQGPA